MYLQNEPFLDADVFRKIKYIKETSNGRITVGLTTNGVLLTPDKIPNLLSADIDELVISLDAFKKETYSKIRVGLNFEKVTNNIEAILKAGYKKSLFVEFTKQKENISEFNDFIKYWKIKGLPILVFTINNRGGGVENFEKHSLKIQKSSLIYILKDFFAHKILKCCPFVLTTFSIRSNGDVIICCNDYTEDIILGNVNESTIKEIWNSERYNQIRKKLNDKKYDEISVCNNCSLWNKNLKK
jgi:radical SAM protein with 4Fe4S-binding SPASM domain